MTITNKASAEPKLPVLFYERIYSSRRIRIFQALAVLWIVASGLLELIRTPKTIALELLGFLPFVIFFLALTHLLYWTPLIIEIDGEMLFVQRGGLTPRRTRVLLREICGLKMTSTEPSMRQSSVKRTLEIELRQGTLMTITTPRCAEIAALLREQAGIPLKERFPVKS